MMRRAFKYIVVLAAIFWGACSAPKSTGVWINTEKAKGKNFGNVFIFVMTADVEARQVLENELAEEATELGIKTVKSMDVMPPSLSSSKTPTKEEIAKKIKETNCDAVFVASLLKKEEDVRYTPGSTAYSPRPYYSWHGNFFGYYNHWQPTVYNEGYYTQDKIYFMQSQLYEVASEELMWSVQSKVFNPKSIKKFADAYTNTLIKQLAEAKLIGKK